MRIGEVNVKRIIILFLSIFIVFCSIKAQNPQTGTLEDALAKAKAAGKPLLVDFFAETG